jgi:DNA-binding winged helix-turn-helix (wHTH) protein/tetratricopeptide (TPR) repeat protein
MAPSRPSFGPITCDGQAMATSAQLRESIGTFQFDSFELDTERFELRSGGTPIMVQPQVLETLAYLVAHRDRVVSKDELMEGPWRGTVVSEGAISQVVFLIRKALSDDATAQRFVKTVRGRGFRFVGDVRFVPAHETAVEVAATVPRASVPEARRFVGRAAELDTILGHFAQAAAGQGALVFVTGEPGIGKTSLVEEAATVLHSRSARIYWGRCREGSGMSPFEPWAQVVRSIVNDVRGSVLPLVAKLHPLFPELASESAPLRSIGEGKGVRLGLFEAVWELIRHGSADAPAVIVLEDLHAADEPSLLLLELISERLAGSRLLVVATLRDTEPTSPLLEPARAARFRDARRVMLSGLEYGDVAVLAPMLFGSALPTELLRAMFDRSSGNPFLVGELVRQVVLASGRDAKARVLETFRLPEGVAEALRQGLATLPPPTRALLASAAVIGREFDLVLLRQTTQLDPGSVLDHLGPALNRQFVREIGLGRFGFSHALVREALYEEQSPGQRAQQHLRVATALETIYSSSLPVAELSHHYANAALVGAVDKALHYQRAAGAIAADRLAYEDAALHFSRALDVVALGAPDDAVKIELLLEHGRASYFGGHGARALKSFVFAMELARGRRDAVSFARAVDGYAAAQKNVFDAPLMSWLEEAIATFPTIDSPLGARLLARLAHAIRFTPDPSRSDELARRAVDIARRHGDQTTLAVAPHSLRWGLRQMLSPEERLKLSQEAVASALAAGDRSLACEARMLVMGDLLELGRRADMDAEMALHAEEARALREPWHQVNTERFRVVVALIEGRFAEADTLAEKVLVAARQVGDQTADLAYWIEMSMLRREQGRFTEVEPFARAMGPLVPNNPAWPSFLSLLLAETGRRDEAAALLSRYTDDPVAIPIDVNYWLTLADLAEACAILGDLERAAALYERLLPHRPYHVVVVNCALYMGPGEHYLGMLAATMNKLDLAIEHFETAIAACERVGAVAWKVRAQLECARARLRRSQGDDQARGASLVASAMATAEQTGMSHVRAQLSGMSAAIGSQN